MPMSWFGFWSVVNLTVCIRARLGRAFRPQGKKEGRRKSPFLFSPVQSSLPAAKLSGWDFLKARRRLSCRESGSSCGNSCIISVVVKPSLSREFGMLLLLNVQLRKSREFLRIHNFKDQLSFTKNVTRKV